MNTLNSSLTSGIAIVTAIIGLAIVAVILSPKSYTANVIGSGGNAFQALIKQAVSPISG